MKNKKIEKEVQTKFNLLRKANYCNIFFSFFFSLALLIDKKIIFKGKINVFSEANFTPFKIEDFFFFIVVLFCNFFLFLLIEKLCKHLNERYSKEYLKKTKPFFIIPFFLLVFSWLPYLLSYFPGGVFADTFVSIKQLANFKEVGFTNLSNNQPILYTLILNICLEVGKKQIHNDLTGGFIFFQIFQYITCALSLAYFFSVLSKKKVPRIFLFLSLAFFGLFPLIPFYVISLWKDTLFHFAFFAYITCLFDFLTTHDYFSCKKNKFLYCLFSFLVCFLRNNGFFIVLGTTIFFFFWFSKKEEKAFKILSTCFLLGTATIQGPIFTLLNINGTTFIESTAIPFQQMAYSIKKGADLSEEQNAFLNSILPIEKIKEIYTPFLFDSIKWDNEFNKEAYTKNKAKFFKTWVTILPKNIKNYTESYLLQTLGFWDPFKQGEEGYIQITIWPGYEEVTQKDLINELTHASIRKILEPKVYISASVFFWFTLLSMLLTYRNKNYKYALLFLPSLLSWLTVMIATPIAFSLRYVYILVLFVPFSIILPFLSEHK